MEKILIIIGAIMVMLGLATSFIIVEAENGHIAALLVALFVAILGWAIIRITLIYSYRRNKTDKLTYR